MIVVALLLSVSLGCVDCGRVKRVVGGTPVDCGSQPYVASLRERRSGRHVCGATVVRPRRALTAAHCVAAPPAGPPEPPGPPGPPAYVLRLDNHCGDAPPVADVLNVTVHPDYDEYTSAHDLAVLEIDLNLDNFEWLDPQLVANNSFGLSGECTVSGYGATGPLPTAAAPGVRVAQGLVAARVRLVSLDTCADALGEPLAPDAGLLCAMGDGADACQGDSGGPLVCGGRVHGVASFGRECGARAPGVYSALAPSRDWLLRALDGDGD